MPIMMIFAVAVIALIVVAGIFAGQSLFHSGNVAVAQQEVAQISANINALYAQQPGYFELDTQSAEQAGLFPKGMIGQYFPVNPFGGATEVSDAHKEPCGCGTGAFPTASFQIQLNDIKDSDCIDLATSVPASWVIVSPDMPYWVMYTGGITPINTVDGQAPTPSAAAAACKNGMDSLIFIFSRKDIS